MENIYEIKVKNAAGEEVSLEDDFIFNYFWSEFYE